MARLAALDPAQADPQAQEILGAIQRSLGKTPNIFKTVAASPSALRALMELRETLGHGKLRLKTRETIALALAQYHACDYCLSAHVASSPKAGMNDAEIGEARNGNSRDVHVEAAATFALAVARHRGGVSNADLEAVRAAGYSDGDVIEIVANVALNIFTNYVNKVAQTEIDFPPVHAHQTE